MKNLSILAVALACVTSTSVTAARKNVADTAKVVNLKEVAILASRATEKTPIAFTNVSANDIARINYGQDIPYLLSSTPSVVTTSDAGAGVGYTSMRVRGTDATRINITANGVPMNDSESHCLYWVNMTDFASSVKDIQIQRGAGTSTNGAGAFGASVNMLTQPFSVKPSVEVMTSYGSFNTHKETVKASSGLINKHWSVDARLSNIGSDGYIDRANVDLSSFYLQGGYFGNKTSLKLIAFGGKEKTYHAWDYASKEDMFNYGRTYNPCGEYYDENGNRKYYDNQTDNYQQYNFQLILNQKLNSAWNFNAALHYTKGLGYYEQYKQNRKVAEYGFDPTVLGVKKSDLVRQKKLDNDFGGGLFSFVYNKGILNAQFGGAASRYGNLHNGLVTWTKATGLIAEDHEYYNNKGKKTDANVYARATVDIYGGLSAFADMQYRYIHYTINGANDEYDYNSGVMQVLNVKDNFNFFNPKAGLNYKFCDKNRVFFSFSVAQKEPTRSNYTDGLFTKYPKAEKLYDYELGYNYTANNFTFGANLYYMWYRDQLVVTGALNEVGKSVAVNVDKSYRMGAELSASWSPVKYFTWSANATFSRNRIKNYIEVVNDNDYVDVPMEISHKDTPIAFSPSTIFNNSFLLKKGAFDAMFTTQYVSKQYMSNVKMESQALDAYCVSNLHLGYNIKTKHVKNIRLGFSIYNLFNEEYENNGWASSGYSENADGKKVVSYYAGYAAQAGTNFMGSLSFKF